MNYIALVKYNDGYMWVANIPDNTPRIFEDRELAETVAKFFEAEYMIVDADEFMKNFNKAS